MIESLHDLPNLMAYLRRIGAEPRSLRTAVVKEQRGRYWKDVATIRVSKTGEITCDDRYAPTEQEADAIAVECASATWPESVAALSLSGLPVENAHESNPALFVFRSDEGIVFVQHRVERDGDKEYIPWSYWSDGRWRKTEPEGPLPLWGMEALGGHSTVFIHEGAKAARHVRWMVESDTPEARAALAAHPWGDELRGAAHVGWIGGALNPLRTDWEVIARAGIKRAYIVADNDEPGRSAVPPIAYHLRCPTFLVQFTEQWPYSFDLADPFPSSMFEDVGGEKWYQGPSFSSCVHPATWATDMVVVNKKRVPKLRDSFRNMWAYIEELDLFVCREMPSIQRTEKVLNNMCAAFSHSNETARLITKTFNGRSTKLVYRPDLRELVISDGTTSAINMHVAPALRESDISPQPWLDYVSYLIPDERERHELLRWCATLIARPDIRMHYGILLVSSTQGIGKTTLPDAVLKPLLGADNVGWPSESDITESAFNSWCANKRLVVASEIYSGHSWKAYNRLKSVITDSTITVNIKFQKAYTVDNWCHMFASSNSMRALKMENDDRRWFYPMVTEEPWPRSKFEELRRWLKFGGLGAVLRWARNFGDYVRPGEHAPMTRAKQELIEDSDSTSQRETRALCDALISLGKPACFALGEVVRYLDRVAKGRVYESNNEICKLMEREGLKLLPSRVRVGGRSERILGNPLLRAAAADADPAGLEAIVKAALVSPDSLLDIPM